MITKINAFDEFGYILWYYAPLSYYHHINGDEIHTKSKIGSSTVFYFSDNHIEENKHFDPPILSKILYPHEHYFSCYNFNGPKFINDKWVPPPYKTYYKNEKYVFDKPILTINNKNTMEWWKHPVNYFNSNILEKIILTFKNDYQIIYIRPPDKGDLYKFQKDKEQNSVNIGDKEVLSRHPEVIDIESLLEDTDKSYNEVQFMVLANSNHHISPAGDSVVPSYFGGDVFMYNCPDCNSKNRGVWKTDSWLKKLSGANIFGFNSYEELLNECIKRWLP